MLAMKFLIMILILSVLVLWNRRSVIINFAEEKLEIVKPIRLIVSLLIFILSIPSMNGFGQIPAGSRGVVLRFGAVTGRILPEGLYYVTPFIESVEVMDVQVHAHISPAKAASKDLQDVSTEITLNYRVDPIHVDKVYADLRREYESRVIYPSVQEAVKACTAAYDAEELIQKRSIVRQLMETSLRERLMSHGILLDVMSITDFQFSHEFSQAIESKVVAAQTALRAENDLRRIKVEAEQRIASAKAEAEAIRIQAEAIMSQGGSQYVNLKAIEKWDGKLPQWTAGGATPFITIPSNK